VFASQDNNDRNRSRQRARTYQQVVSQSRTRSNSAPVVVILSRTQDTKRRYLLAVASFSHTRRKTSSSPVAAVLQTDHLSYILAYLSLIKGFLRIYRYFPLSLPF